MKKNMGTMDKIIRVIIAVIIAILYFTNLITGLLATILLVLAVVFLLTSMMGFCGLYKIFGFSTCPVKKTKDVESKTEVKTE